MSVTERIPDGFELRPPSVEEAPALAELVNESMVAEVGEPWTTVEKLRDELTAPGKDGAHDDAVLIDGRGNPAGLLQLWGTSLRTPRSRPPSTCVLVCGDVG